ncbi:uncharacterized protein LOC131658373 [Vicia villosa]|uniref:uncharacterized protein LOC131658373 n=1 Tax=Vicia villosa TaxID=3911 RepID=UPI00273AD9EA|nr:uncharacterized protein LOC131658373 [Vicia villosa]
MATKDRLAKFEIIQDTRCCFCREDESLNHIMFQCQPLNTIWQFVLNRLQIDHNLLIWREELDWILKERNGKGCRAMVLKCYFAETIYEIWNYRNVVCFKKEKTHGDIGAKIVDTIIQRCWMKPNLRKQIGTLMMP